MRLCFLHPTLSYQGGAEVSLLYLCGALADMGHHVTIATSGLNNRIIASFKDKIRFIDLNRETSFHNWSRLPEDAMQILRGMDVICAQNYPSYLWLPHSEASPHDFPPVIHFCQEPPQRLYAGITQRHFLSSSVQGPMLLRGLVYASRLRLKLLGLTSYWSGARRMEQRARRQLRGTIANSGFTADNCQRLAYPHPIKVCHLGIPDFGQSGTANSFTSATAPRQVLIPGRWSAIKNLTTTIQALHILHKDTPELLKRDGVTIIGDGRVKPFIEKACSATKLGDVIRVLNQVPHAEMGTQYREHQVVMAIPFDEPFGLVPIEAMAAARPVIGADQGGLRETVQHQETGLLIPPNDANAAAKALKNLLENNALRDTYGRAGRKIFEKRFTIAHFAQRFIHCVHSLGL